MLGILLSKMALSYGRNVSIDVNVFPFTIEENVVTKPVYIANNDWMSAGITIEG